MRLSAVISFLGCIVTASATAQSRPSLSSVQPKFESHVTAFSCADCEFILGFLKFLAGFGDSVFSSFLAGICTLLEIEDADVCNGLLERQGPIIAQSIRGIRPNSDTSHVICAIIFGVCSYPQARPFPFPFPSQKPANATRPGVSGLTPLKVVQYSDIHVDLLYEVGSNYNCTKPICCRPYTKSDAPGNTPFPAGPNGEHSCDTPLSLEESMYAAIRSIAPDAAFTLFTGDIPDHAIWNTTERQTIINIDDAYIRMADSKFPLVYGAVGNHESHPVNAFQTTAEGSQAQWVYDTLEANWAKWIGPNADEAVAKMGAYNVAYTSPAGGRLRIISLNTNMYYIDNFYLYEDPMEQDPSGQWAWLVKQLNDAEKAGDRVYIIGHMPMGLPDAFHEGSNYFDQIVNRYEYTIAAMFFGHTHLDHFEISYSNYSSQNFTNAVATSYIMPSLTPTSGMPAFRIYTVDPLTFAVLDSETYIADMSDPSFQKTPVWKPYYSAKSAYGPLVQPPLTDPAAELTPAFWHNVTAAFAADQEAFNAYYARKSRDWDVGACTGACVTEEICALRAGRSQDNCEKPNPWGRRFSESGRQRRKECGAPALGETLAALGTAEGGELLRQRLKELRVR
ncbi:Metallo-dependent phosphatase-like protein [Corynascus novoguineensis]|uniref:Sphingomyelin phosphodiesterase n=1 Tax=Corynascus novoguineensis TaxID=1126955 RepID=A0AAN7D2A7_9PEZI|nr:Metallo-dependent phosphatase-like protein [Corynascus novoguineensis]